MVNSSHPLDRLYELGMAGVRRAGSRLRQIVRYGIGDDEIPVGKSLHQRAGAEAVCAVVGEIGLAEHKESGDIALQIIVHPETAHGIMRRRVDAHRLSVGIFVGNLFVHLEKVAVAFAYRLLSEALDGIGKIQVDAPAARADAAAFIADLLRRAGRYVAGRKVAEARVFPLKIVVAFFFRDLVGRPPVSL